MIFLFTNPSAQGALIAGYLDAEVAPANSSNYIIADEVPIPSELLGYASNWEEAIEKGLASFFILSSETASLVPIESWQKCQSLDLLEINGLTYYQSGEIFHIPEQFLTFFETNYTSLETPHLFQWYEALDRAASLQMSMTSEINDYLLAGVGFTPVFATLNNIFNNLETIYDTPNEAVVAMSGGLSGLATLYGTSWPPTDPI